MAPPAVGGMEAVIAGLGLRQVAHGLDVRVVTLDRSPGLSAWRGMRVHRLRRLGPRRYPFAWRLREALEGVDVVHVHGVDGLADQAIGVAQALGAKVGVSTHGAYFHTTRQARIKAIWVRTVTRWSLGRADAIWFTSQRDQQRLSPAGLVGQVIDNGIELGRFEQVAREPESGRWLCLGRVDEHKGHDRLLRVLAAVRRGGHDVVLDVVGAAASATLLGRLKRQADQLGLGPAVRWWGRLADGEVSGLVARAELAVFPSRAEGFGLAVAEMMAAGVPVAVSDIAAHRERLGAERRGGWCVPFDDEAAATRVLADLVGRVPQDVGAAGRARALAWSWDAAWPRWRAAYDDLGLSR